MPQQAKRALPRDRLRVAQQLNRTGSWGVEARDLKKQINADLTPCIVRRESVVLPAPNGCGSIGWRSWGLQIHLDGDHRDSTVQMSH